MTKAQKTNQSIAPAIINELNEKHHIELFTNQHGEAHATFDVGGHRETWPLDSAKFKELIGYVSYQMLESAPRRETVERIVSTLSAKARFDGMREHTHLRVAQLGTKLYLDLTDDDWRAVEIDEQGWRVVTRSPVRFVRDIRARALPEPMDGSVQELRTLVPFASDDDFILAVAFLVSCLNPTGPYLVAAIIGKKGTGKTETSKILKNLVDPTDTIEGSIPRREQDLWIRAQHQHVVFFGNLRRLSSDMSDALARLATGGGICTRKHYTNGELFVLQAERPMLLNSIYNFIEQPDLADRCVFLELAGFTRGGAQRTTRAELQRRFQDLAPRVLGALCRAVSATLSSSEDIATEDVRMADALMFASAAEQALGFEKGAILDAYKRQLDRRRQRLLEALPVVDVVLRFVDEKGPWEGTWPALLCGLDELAGDSRSFRDWPKSTRQLSNIIYGAQDLLAEEGVGLDRWRDGTKSNRRGIRLYRLDGTTHETDESDSSDAEFGNGDADDDYPF